MSQSRRDASMIDGPQWTLSIRYTHVYDDLHTYNCTCTARRLGYRKEPTKLGPYFKYNVDQIHHAPTPVQHIYKPESFSAQLVTY